jgi:hypothetical protein
MDPTLKAKWTATLRSGEYVQGTGCLRTSAGHYCCLGVLCVVAGFKMDEEGYNVIDADGREVGYAPIKAATKAEDLITLYSMNDDGVPFADIADYIDAKL